MSAEEAYGAACDALEQALYALVEEGHYDPPSAEANVADARTVAAVLDIQGWQVVRKHQGGGGRGHTDGDATAGHVALEDRATPDRDGSPRSTSRVVLTVDCRPCGGTGAVRAFDLTVPEPDRQWTGSLCPVCRGLGVHMAEQVTA